MRSTCLTVSLRAIENNYRRIRAALKFDRAEDVSAPELQKALKEQGIDYVLEHYMGLKPDEPLFKMIKG